MNSNFGKLKISWVDKPVATVISHYVAVFLVAFGTSVVAGSQVSGLSYPALKAVLVAGFAAGLAAVGHVVLGLIPQDGLQGVVGISVKVKTNLRAVLVSAVVLFVSVLAAQLATGGAHLTSLPDLTAVVISAISAAVAAVVQYVANLVPGANPVPA